MTEKNVFLFDFFIAFSLIGKNNYAIIFLLLFNFFIIIARQKRRKQRLCVYKLKLSQ